MNLFLAPIRRRLLDRYVAISPYLAVGILVPATAGFLITDGHMMQWIPGMQYLIVAALLFPTVGTGIGVGRMQAELVIDAAEARRKAEESRKLLDLVLKHKG